LGDGEIVAFDTHDARVVATIPNVSAVHGVLVIPECRLSSPRRPERMKCCNRREDPQDRRGRAGRCVPRRHRVCARCIQAIRFR
jgi:hypothetical protein